MRKIVNILLALAVATLSFVMYAQSPVNNNGPIRSTRLKKETSSTNTPRTLGDLFITCYYNNEYLEVEVPADVEYMEVVVSNEVGTIWTGLVTPESAECDIPYLSGQYLITCTTDSGTIYQGILSF
ncbi:MAG: hypothetical protein E7084_08030 [Bacteroidales bacterium]|nr:hypothetical protein [Bacteroidales bacterium]